MPLPQLEIAQKCGTNVIALNPAKVDLKKEIDALTDGFGCDVYIELTGNPQSVRQGLDCIARHGRFVEYAVFGKEVTADWSIISDCKELTIVGGHLGPRQWPSRWWRTRSCRSRTSSRTSFHSPSSLKVSRW